MVEFGQTSDYEPARHRVPLDELSRIEQPAAPPHHAAWLTPPRPPAPLSTDQLAANLNQRRERLREAYRHRERAEEQVAAARRFADTAQDAVASARSMLAEANATSAAARDAFERAIRTGEPPQFKNGTDLVAIRERVSAAKAALDTFNRELAEANTALADANTQVRIAAANCLAAMLEREGERLRSMEQEAAAMRARLTSIAAWWPGSDTGPLKLAPATGQLLEVMPPYGDSVPRHREQWQAQYKALFDRFVGGETDADLEHSAP